jgi:hypothetical protein
VGLRHCGLRFVLAQVTEAVIFRRRSQLTRGSPGDVMTGKVLATGSNVAAGNHNVEGGPVRHCCLFRLTRTVRP